MDRLGDNRVALGGRVLEVPRRRYSPAGIAIVQFTLEHRSEQLESDARRPRARESRLVISARRIERLAQVDGTAGV